MKAWKKLEKVFEKQEEMTGYITGKVKGGFVTTVDGLPCFMPSSQIDVKPLKRIDHLMNTPVRVIATRIDKNRGNVCVSRRAVLEKSKNAEITEALKNIKEGDIVESAVVKATTDWGIFLDVNGIDALLHVSDLSHGRVKKPADLVTIGQKLKCKIKDKNIINYTNNDLHLHILLKNAHWTSMKKACLCNYFLRLH